MKIKARDVVADFRTKGAERASVEIFVAIIEHMSVMNEQLNELTHTCNRLIDMLGATSAGYADLRRQVEKVRRKQQDDDLPDVIQ